ncbi:MAG: DUF3180 domain-containing protein [Nocardioidaceae bacterium]
MTNTPGQQQGTVRPTRLVVLAVLFVVGGLLGFGLVPLAESINNTAPRVEWTSVGALALIAGLLLVLANWMHRTVHRERRNVDAQRAVSFLLLAKASSLVGAVIAGGYLGFSLHFIGDMNIPLPRERVIHSLAAALAALIMVVGGLLLEHACRVPKDDDDG